MTEDESAVCSHDVREASGPTKPVKILAAFNVNEDIIIKNVSNKLQKPHDRFIGIGLCNSKICV